MDPELGVTHGTDMAIWFFGNGLPLFEKEKELTRRFLEPWAKFLNGDEFVWGTQGIDEFRKITADGKDIAIEKDTRWDESLRIWSSIFEGDNVLQ